MEGLTKSDANLIVYVHPSQSKNVDKAILRELSTLLFKYSQAFDGVVLAYSVDPQDNSEHAFRGKDNENIRNELKYKAKHGEGVYVSRYHKRHVIKVGAVIRFVVKSLDEEILHISGSLIPTNTGSVHWLDKYFVDAATDSNKEAKTEEEIEMQEQIIVGRETLPSVNDHKVKKSKKRRRAEDQ
ncbi:DNA-DIRECTED RNA polymerase I SUBUNIT RPA43 [Salix koriyanagi]|uniref:DNA-DIRECTED RNA polymerase I SUBUNIT RPA43 n=1 Tax=Salix koriyanagi TaxID=2511006 RepID=A0A9Q0SKT1_9ROSI|nr:DNA-DIRECTED RNA polymerase I SUBUNIT RPA43 [Salix koriyanagi]